MASSKRKTVRFFTIAQLSIIILFAIVSALSLLRLSEMQDVLLSLTRESVPIITRSSSLNTDIQSLATLTKFLAESHNTSEKQLANRKLTAAISKININITNSITDTTYLAKQLSTVYKEIGELNELVTQKIRQQESLIDDFALFYNYLNTILMQTDYDDTAQIEGILLEILMLAVDINQQTRLHTLRKIEADLKTQFQEAEQSAQIVDKKTQQNLSALKAMLFGQAGLVNQKVLSLKLDGRTRGRDSFVKNLIADVASNLQYQSQLINQKVFDQANRATNEASRQTTFTIWASGIAVVVAFGFIYFLYRQIVLRLLQLSAQVNRAAEDHSIKVEIKGNDEIAGLAKTFSVFLQRVRDQEEALLDMTLTDPLTGIPNRRAFDKQIQDAISQANRNGWALTILLIDIDYFKPYNDHYGHTDGDACLRLVANQLNSVVLRNTDFCARFGGEEFVCLLPNTDAKGAQYKAEELRKAVESMKIPHIKSVIDDYITISIGAATFSFGNDNKWRSDIIIEQADKALYQAKDEGRNRCNYFAVN